jgi:hypothetical protein
MESAARYITTTSEDLRRIPQLVSQLVEASDYGADAEEQERDLELTLDFSG